jgi:predicted unusual protein kinase regulating ubiquinone biosynthesis (AarF/ABC1/UbiB family)
MFVLPDNRIGYVDFGIVGALVPAARDSLAHFARMLFGGEVDDALDELMRWIAPTPSTDLSAARRDLRLTLERCVEMMDRAEARKAVFPAFEVEVLEVIRRHAMALSPAISMYFKALVTMTAVLYQLVPDFDLQKHENRFFARLIRDETMQMLNPDRLLLELFNARFRVRRALEAASAFEPIGRGFEDVVDRAARRVQWLAALMLLAGGALFLLTRPNWRLSERLPSWTPVALSVGLGVLVVLMMVQGRELRVARHASAGNARRAFWMRWGPRSGAGR